ncbi:sulfatase [Haloferula helveola]|uniref:Sulfatase n=1 Tax=Haloferula helveola TaxID=490095 RepID=A0ABN6H0V4_9BACT|nr:sulfatase [Haloferula helveola]
MNASPDIDDFLGMTRRHFFKKSAAGIGGAALASMLPGRGDLLAPDFPAKAKRVIFLCQSGGPSHLDLFDDKPLLREMNGQQLPEHVRAGQRLTGMSANQSSIPLAGSQFKFARHGQSGAELSELLPHTASVADEICFIKSMYTEAINHDPAITFLQTGSQLSGRPSMGAWLSYGLGSLNNNLPSFIVLVSAGQGGQPLYSRLWGSGFLDSRFQGVRFRSGKEPVLYLTNPEGVSAAGRRGMLDKLATLNRHQFDKELDPEIESRIAQYEMAFRMQTSVPEVTDLSDEPDSTFELYGKDSRKPGTFAANCLQARRLAERGVRFIQLYHQGWDQHGNLPGGIRGQCAETDQASAALIKDLKQRGMLDETLVIWGGEFGRTSYSQGALTKTTYGRDHHPRCYTMWMAGGGAKPGVTHGKTDDYGYNIVDAAGNVIHPTKHHVHPDAVHIHDLQATILHLMGIDHRHLNFKYQGRRFRLTDVHGHVVKPLLA